MLSSLARHFTKQTRRLSTIPRSTWTAAEIDAIYTRPLLDLLHTSSAVHTQAFRSNEIQKCTLLSIKTGGCPEDCSYCSQSSRHATPVKAQRLLPTEEVLARARAARAAGSTRFCLGAAWRGPSQVSERQFGRVLEMVRGVRGLGMEACATLGLLTPAQARELKDAGLTAYNHNLDTSAEYYPRVITTRSYSDRLATLQHVRDAGISVCCGGILGLGESHADRVALLHALASMETHPESVPINALVPSPGTPLEGSDSVPIWDLLRMIATARIVLPRSMVRLSAGRLALSKPEQALCFLAGANSVFVGDKLLTADNPEEKDDEHLFSVLGLVGQKPFAGPLEEAEKTVDAA